MAVPRGPATWPRPPAQARRRLLQHPEPRFTLNGRRPVFSRELVRVLALRAVRVPRRVGAVCWLVIATLAAGPAPIAAQGVQPTDRAWRASDVALASVFTVALWIDAAQTRQGVRRGYDELNPILGRHPTGGPVNGSKAGG